MAEEEGVDEIHQLLIDRQETHGDAWLVAGQYLAAMNSLLDNLRKTPYYFAWLMIFVKLIRAATTPMHDEHWRDIIGYATLVRDHLKASKQ